MDLLPRTFAKRPARRRGLVAAALAALALGHAAAALAQPPAGVSSRSWANASCVAALELQGETLAGQIKAGQPELTELLRERLRAGAAFIGQAYLDGERDEQKAKEVLQQARQAQRALPPAELAAQQERCAAEGGRLLAEANVLARSLASRAAERRMRKLLSS